MDIAQIVVNKLQQELANMTLRAMLAEATVDALQQEQNSVEVDD